MSSYLAHSLLCSSRCLASGLHSWNNPFAALKCATIAAFSAQAQTQAVDTGPSTSGRRSGTDSTTSGARGLSGAKPKASSPPFPPSSAKQQQNPAQRTPSAAAVAASSSHLAPTRLLQYVQTILHRELLLKLGPRSWDQVPRLVSVEARVHAAETHLNNEEVEKWELLLYSLALETLTGHPTTFMAPTNTKNSATRTSGVMVRLDVATDPDMAYSFMEKLIHVILPNQVGFSGVPPPTLVTPLLGDKAAAAKAAKAALLDHRKAPLRPHVTEFRVTNLLQYPDFEQSFWLFEQLRGMRVRLVMEGASAADCSLLLSGLSLPVLTGAAAEAALAELAAEARRRSRVAV
ncbi:hypothetical protein VaNZ11_013774 [Volvox africanus]|uniref:Uncharacterized protein n=1 Tax=Volvox africanus TaxID=51714 RepID=A0ABQ5SIM6_9CHLO|nr:hypothetical protein VaNZ11_013774 [Volvox africanus]